MRRLLRDAPEEVRETWFVCAVCHGIRKVERHGTQAPGARDVSAFKNNVRLPVNDIVAVFAFWLERQNEERSRSRTKVLGYTL
jgi:hypothetical protein